MEASPREVAARKSNVCTNHFHLLDKENRYRQEDSRRREETIQKQQQHATDAYQAFRIMNDTDKDVFQKNMTHRPAHSIQLLTSRTR